MAWKKKFRTKDGKIVVLRDLNRKDSAKKLMDFINHFVEEKAFLLIDRKISLNGERKWLKQRREQIKKGEFVYIIMEHDGKMIGSANAEREPYKFRNNVKLGIAINPEFRGKGLGYLTMKELIGRVKKEMKPKNIALCVFSQNNAAKKLYKKLGFKHHHTLKNWVNHYGKYYDKEFLILKK